MGTSEIACIGTGPSLTMDQVEAARRRGFRLFGCNNVYQIVPDLELLYACNEGWWRTYWEDVRNHPCEKWTTNRGAAETYGINWIAERDAPGLSTDPDVIHHGHGSGYSLVSMAHKAGAKRVVLLGYDLKYAPDYDGRARSVGSAPRHYFGEYPASLQHWPSVQVKGGVHVGLVDLYRSIRDQGLVELINATPGSALEPVLGFTAIDAI